MRSLYQFLANSNSIARAWTCAVVTNLHACFVGPQSLGQEIKEVGTQDVKFGCFLTSFRLILKFSGILLFNGTRAQDVDFCQFTYVLLFQVLIILYVHLLNNLCLAGRVKKLMLSFIKLIP